MSVGGPSPLGTLLVQRLDAVLGTTLSQQANLVSGARPDAVAQAASPERAEGTRNETLRHPRDVVDRATAQTEQNARNMVDKARQEARSATLLLARDIPSTASTPSAPTTLGHTAKTILALLAGYPDLHASVQGRQPLLQSNAQAGASAANAGSAAASRATAPSANAAATAASRSAAPQAATPIVPQLATALAQAVQGSGLFYEAHLAGLAFGKLSPAQLMQEPQAQIGRPAGTQSAQPVHIPGLDPQVHALVRQQLEVLANQSFVWQGEAWPGADMEWEISRRPSQDQDAAEDADHWATRLTLNLPGLGQVQARLNLAGKQLVMHLVSPQSAELLDTHAEALRSRYVAQGLQLSQLSIVSQDAHQQDAAPQSNTGTS